MGKDQKLAVVILFIGGLMMGFSCRGFFDRAIAIPCYSISETRSE
jgi:hypothetical protein